MRYELRLRAKLPTFFAPILVAVAAGATPAAAVSWGELTVYTDGVAQGSARGSWSVSRSGSYGTAKFDGQVIDRRPSNESIYYTTWSFSRACSTCSTGGPAYAESARWNGDYWRNIDVSASLGSGMNQARANVRACEDQRFSPDDCSSPWSSSWINY